MDIPFVICVKEKYDVTKRQAKFMPITKEPLFTYYYKNINGYFLEKYKKP